jgi:hypothetical protein
MKKLLWAALLLSPFGMLSHAQDTPRAEISAGVSDLYIIKGLTINMTGASGAVAVNANHWVGVVGDFGFYFGHVGPSITGETYTFGPRLSFRKPGGRFVPFAQALFGGSHFSMDTSGISGEGTESAFGLGGGGDIVLGSSGKFALRGQVEYFGLSANSSTTNSVRLSGGIVYRIGRKLAGGT